VLSTFTTSLALRYRAGIVGGVEALLPHKLTRVLVLYESWWQQLREPSNEPRHHVRAIVAALVLDAIVLAVIIFSWQVWQDELGDALAGAFGLGNDVSRTISVLALGLSLLPPLVTCSSSLAFFHASS